MADAPAKPDILLILASQLRADIPAPFSGQQCPTPNLDRLAACGTTFLRHFTTCPLGAPARATLATGLHPANHGARINGTPHNHQQHAVIRAGTPLLHRQLIDAGYRVVHVGVQNTRTDPDLRAQVPEVEFVGPMSVAEYLKQLDDTGLLYGDLEQLRDPVLDHVEGKPVVLGGMSPRTLVFPLKEELFFDRVVADHAVRVMKGHSEQQGRRPLALLCNFNLPHTPLWAPQDYAELFDPALVKMPATTGKWYRSTSPIQLANIPGQLGARLTPDHWRQPWAMVLGMVHLLDKCLGLVLDEAQRTGLLDNALVAFASDHGEMLGSRRLFGKMCLYDPAVRVPLIIKPPGAPNQLPKRHLWGLTSHTDLHATLLDYAHIQPLPNAHGQSLKDALHNGEERAPQNDHVFAAFDGNAGLNHRQRMIRSRTHKLIHNVGHAPEFYDLVDDPRETRNLLKNKEHQSNLIQLAKRLNRWMDQVGDDAQRL